jgi:hypothetical protein
MMRKPNVILDRQLTAEEREEFVEIPFGDNDRMWECLLFNRGRQTSGTLTIWRLRILFQCIKKRYPSAYSSTASHRKPLVTVRRRKAGDVIAYVKPMVGPAASVASKH